jgi:hypothetical protein
LIILIILGEEYSYEATKLYNKQINISAFWLNYLRYYWVPKEDSAPWSSNGRQGERVLK